MAKAKERTLLQRVVELEGQVLLQKKRIESESLARGKAESAFRKAHGGLASRTAYLEADAVRIDADARLKALAKDVATLDKLGVERKQRLDDVFRKANETAESSLQAIDKIISDTEKAVKDMVAGAVAVLVTDAQFRARMASLVPQPDLEKVRDEVYKQAQKRMVDGIERAIKAAVEERVQVIVKNINLHSTANSLLHHIVAQRVEKWLGGQADPLVERVAAAADRDIEREVLKYDVPPVPVDRSSQTG